MPLQNQIIEILSEVLQLNSSAIKKIDSKTPLLGAIAEFDSIAVVSVITALEDSFGFSIDDDEINAEVFETVSSLVEFVDQKLHTI